MAGDAQSLLYRSFADRDESRCKFRFMPIADNDHGAGALSRRVSSAASAKTQFRNAAIFGTRYDIEFNVTSIWLLIR